MAPLATICRVLILGRSVGAGALDVVELLTEEVMEDLDKILQTKPPADPMANYRTTAAKM